MFIMMTTGGITIKTETGIDRGRRNGLGFYVDDFVWLVGSGFDYRKSDRVYGIRI
jgi:hypothetical protein